MVLEKDPRGLHYDLQAAEATVCHTDHSLSKEDLRIHPLL